MADLPQPKVINVFTIQTYMESNSEANLNPNKLSDKGIAISVGVFFVIVIIVLSLFIPCPSSSQYNIFRIVISIAIAGVASIVPGSFELKLNSGITAAGALAIFGFVYYFDPAQLNKPDNCDNFEVTVYVYKIGNLNDRLKNKGSVLIDMGNDSRKESIGTKGEAHFTEIPLKFWNKKIRLGLSDADIFKPSYPDSAYILNGQPIYLAVQPFGLDQVSGTVKDEQGRLLDSAIVRIKNIQDTTDAQGFFLLKIPAAAQAREQQVTIVRRGYKTWEGIATPETGQELKAILQK